MKKNFLRALICCIIFLLAFVACAPTVHTIGQQPEILNNDLEGGVLTFTNDIEGECFDIITEYSTDYSTEDWHITDSKTLRIRAWVDFEPGCTATTPNVYMEHMHADVNMQATKPIIDGWTQDSMDDKIHGSMQPGFYMSEIAMYEEIFAIEAYTEQFIEGWQSYFYYYGTGNVSSERPTEEELADQGVYGSKIVVVFDIAVEDNNGKYHGRSFVNEMLVPTAKYDQIIADYWNDVATATAYYAGEETATPEPAE